MATAMMPHDGPWAWKAAVARAWTAKGSLGRLRAIVTVSTTVLVSTTVSGLSGLAGCGMLTVSS